MLPSATTVLPLLFLTSVFSPTVAFLFSGFFSDDDPITEREACEADGTACYWDDYEERCITRYPAPWRSDPVFLGTSSMGASDDCGVLATRLARARAGFFYGCSPAIFDTPDSRAAATDCKLTARLVSAHDCATWDGSALPRSACPSDELMLDHEPDHQSPQRGHRSHVCCLIMVNHPYACAELNSHDRHFCEQWAKRHKMPPTPRLDRFSTGRIKRYEYDEYM